MAETEAIQREDPDQILVGQLLPKLDKIWQLTTDVWSLERKYHVGKIRTKLLARIIKANILLDPNWKEDYNPLTDRVLIKVHTRLLWTYSKLNPQDAATRYNALITRLYNFGLSLGDKKDAFDKFRLDASAATDDNPAWELITATDQAARASICQTAMTMTSALIFSSSNDAQRINENLWNKRMLQGGQEGFQEV